MTSVFFIKKPGKPGLFFISSNVLKYKSDPASTPGPSPIFLSVQTHSLFF